MSLFQRQLGIVGSLFQVGGPTGPQWKNNSGVLESRNSADNAFAVVRGAAAVGNSDHVTFGGWASTNIFFANTSGQFGNSSKLTWDDSGNVLQVGAPSGTTTWRAPSGSTFTIGQATPGSDVATTDLTVAAQAPFASATSTNRNSANLLLAIAAPVTGGVSGAAKVTIGGTTYAQLGGASTDFIVLGGTSGTGANGTRVSDTGQVRIPFPASGSTVFWAARASSTDISLISLVTTGSLVTFGNLASLLTTVQGGLGVTISAAGPHSMSVRTTAPFISYSSISSFQYGPGTAGDTISHAFATLGSDVLASGVSFTAQSAFATAATNLNGGKILVAGGDAKTNGSSGLRGGVQLALGTAGIMVETAEVLAGNRVVALCRSTAVTSTQMPANSGDRVVYLADAGTAPTANPASGGVLYSSSGSLRWMGSSGQSMPIGPMWVVVSKSGTYTANIGELVLCTTTSGFTVTLPTAVGNGGSSIAVKKVSSDGNALTIATTSSQTIDGASTQSLTVQNSSLTMISDGSNWEIV